MKEQPKPICEEQELLEKEELELFRKAADKDCVYVYSRCFLVGFNTARYYLDDEEEAKDAIQEVFANLWTMKHSEKMKVENFQHYFVQSIRNHCLTLIDKQKRRKARLKGYTPETNVEPYDSSKEEQLKIIHNEIDGLSSECREVLLLVYVYGFTHEQVAKIKGRSKTTIKTQVYSGIEKIKKRLGIK
jgi:RNA polymerase sigma factor (sigma-70 family)